MATANAKLELYEIPGVEIFAAGDYGDGDKVTAEDLKETVRNYYRLRRIHTPPVGLGHDEDQAKLPLLLNSPARPWFLGPTGRERSDAPAAGWCRNLRYVPDQHGGIIVADFAEVPDPVARLIESRSYRRVSSELYTFRDGLGGTYRNTLRRVCLEGFTPPVVKRLSDLPLPVKMKQYAERGRAGFARTILRPLRNSVHAGFGVTYFAEVTTVNKSAMLDAIRSAGVRLSDSACAALTDSDVRAMYTSVVTRRYAETPPPTNPADGSSGAAGSGQDGDMGREEMIEALAAMGEDAAQLASLSDEDLKALYMKRTADGGAGGANGAQAEAVKMYAEATRLFREARTERKKIAIDETLNRLVRAGKVTPAERPGLEVQLLEADDQQIRKFSEGQKQYAETSFAAQLRRLEARRPVVKLGERNDPQPDAKPDTATIDAEAEKVRQYAEDNAGAIKAFGYSSPEKYVGEFRRLHTAGIAKSADQFTGGSK